MDQQAKPCHQLGKDVLEVENERRNLNISSFLCCFYCNSDSECERIRAEREREKETEGERVREMKKSGGPEKKRVRRSSGALPNGGRDPSSDTPPRVCLPLLFS